MSEDQLSGADKIRIRRAVQSAKDWQAANPEQPDVLDMGRSLANLLRSEMPDIDVVEMGRVCLNLAEFLDAMIDEPDAPQCPAIMAASNQIKTAGFDLTAIEWEESP